MALARARALPGLRGAALQWRYTRQSLRSVQPRCFALAADSVLEPAAAFSDFSALELAQESLALAEAALSAALLERLEGKLPARDDSTGRGGELSASGAPSWSTASAEEACVVFKPVNPMRILQQLRKDPEEPLAMDTVNDVLSQALALFSEAPVALVRRQVPKHGPDAQAIVVGDLHGQIADLLLIFERHGPPGEFNRYIFLGDICDRGIFSVEMWILILAFGLHRPGSVTIIRGNHENSSMFERPLRSGGGFAEMCRLRYPEEPRLSRTFDQLFMLLPLFVLLENEVFLVHGGLPRVSMSLADLEKLDFQRPYPAPRSKKQILAGVPLSWTDADKVLFDCQWADPHDGTGFISSTRGHDGVNFGRDVTRNFCADNQLRLVIRAHQVPEDMRGIKWHHGGKLLTVFSASRYGGVMQNLGGVAKFRHCDKKGLDIQIVEHRAPSVDDLPFVFASASTANLAAVGRVLRQLRPSDGDEEYESMRQHLEGILCANRGHLWAKCERMEVAPGKVWSHDLAMEISRLSLTPEDSVDIWERVLSRLAGAGEDGARLLNYQTLLERFEVRWSSSTSSMQSLLGAIMHAQLALPEAIALFDENLSDTVELRECRQVLEKLLPSLSARQLKHILKTLQAFWGGANEVRVGRFLAALCADFAPPPSEQQVPEWLPSTLEALGAHLAMRAPEVGAATAADEALDADAARRLALGEALLATFRSWDTNGDGLLSRAEIVEALQQEAPLQQLGLDDPARMDALIDHFDVVGTSGTVSLFELLPPFLRRSDAAPSWASAHDMALPTDLADAHALLFAHRPTLLQGCRALDAAAEGHLLRDDFLDVVAALVRAVEDTAVGALHPDLLERGGKAALVNDLKCRLPDVIAYEEFLSGLQVVDRTPLTVDKSTRASERSSPSLQF